MSRMFRVVNGGSHEPVSGREMDTAEQPMTDPFAGDSIPYVEIGGPEGLTSSVTKTKPTVYAPPAEPRQREMPPTVPMTAGIRAGSGLHLDSRDALPNLPEMNESRILSVTFHKIPKPGLKLLKTGIAPEIVTYHFPDHPVSSEYRVVAEEILRQYEPATKRVVMFGSSAPLAGATTVLVNYAVTLSQMQNSRVLLVDANFARPGIARRMAGVEAPGLAEVLNQSIPLSWALQPTGVNNVHLLSNGQANDYTESGLINDFPKLISQLRQWFDWVVIDAGVWSDLPGADGAGESSDGVYLVARHSELESPALSSTRRDIEAGRGAVRGFISTR